MLTAGIKVVIRCWGRGKTVAHINYKELFDEDTKVKESDFGFGRDAVDFFRKPLRGLPAK